MLDYSLLVKGIKQTEDVCQEDNKESTGCSQSQNPILKSQMNYPMGCNGSVDKRKSESLPTTPIGKSLSSLKGKFDLEESRPSSATPVTPSYQEVKTPNNMSGRKTPESPTPSSRYDVCECCNSSFEDYCGEYYFICDECINDPIFNKY